MQVIPIHNVLRTRCEAGEVLSVLMLCMKRRYRECCVQSKLASRQIFDESLFFLRVLPLFQVVFLFSVIQTCLVLPYMCCGDGSV